MLPVRRQGATSSVPGEGFRDRRQHSGHRGGWFCALPEQAKYESAQIGLCAVMRFSVGIEHKWPVIKYTDGQVRGAKQSIGSVSIDR